MTKANYWNGDERIVAPHSQWVHEQEKEVLPVVYDHEGGMPGSFCTRVNETNWYERSHLWREERSIVQSRS
jgi:hypothetical protein